MRFSTAIHSTGTPEQYNAKAAEVRAEWEALPELKEYRHTEEQARASRELVGMEVSGWTAEDYEAALAANGLSVDIHPIGPDGSLDESLYQAAVAHDEKYGDSSGPKAQ